MHSTRALWLCGRRGLSRRARALFELGSTRSTFLEILALRRASVFLTAVRLPRCLLVLTAESVDIFCTKLFSSRQRYNGLWYMLPVNLLLQGIFRELFRYGSYITARGIRESEKISG